MMKNIICFVSILFIVTSCYDDFYTEGRVKTNNVTEITKNSAILHGNVKLAITGKHSDPEIWCGFAIGTNSTNLIMIKSTNFVKINNGDFSFSLDDLTPNTKYYVKACIKLNYNVLDDEIQEIFYGNLVEFMTDDGVILPTVSTDQPSDVTSTSATLRGTIVSIGIPAYTKRGFVFSKNQNPKLDGNGLPESNVTMIEVSGTGNGYFSTSATGLTNNSTYYVRAYASIDFNNVVYGEQISFVAETVLPFIKLPAAGIAVQNEDITATSINWTSAKTLCENSIVGDFNDWRIPTIEELATLYSNRNVIGGFKNNINVPRPAYWSSTLSSSDYFYVYYYQINFLTGSQMTGRDNQDRSSNNAFYYYCRCVRTI